MQLIMENWRQHQNKVEVEDLITEINQLSKEIIDYASLLTEQQLLNEEFVAKAAAWFGEKWEQLSGKVDQLYQKSKDIFANIKAVPAKVADAYLKASVETYMALSRLIPEPEQVKINRVLKEFATAIINICDEKMGPAFHDTVHEVVKETMAAYVAASDLPENKKEQIQWFKDHQKEYLPVIEKEIKEHPALREMKLVIENAIDQEGEQIFEEIRGRLNVKLTWKSAKSFMVGGSFMFVFGLIDNVGVLMGMEGLEKYIEGMLGFTAVVSGLGANTFSDELGIALAFPVALALKKYLGVKGEGTFMQQFVMIGAGCGVVMVLRMLWEMYFMHGFVPS